MSFLNPAFLWTLPLLSLPLIFHLINKRPPKNQPFSYVPWLQAVHKAAMPKKKLKEILLLILRTALVLFLVLFFSRPVLMHGGAGTGRSENSTMMFLVDVSASMGARTAGRTALDVALDNLASLLRQIPSDTRVGFLAYSDRVETELAPTNERARLMSSIKELSVHPRPTDIKPALEMAYKMLASQTGRKSLVILSDQAENGYDSLLQNEGRFSDYDPEVSVVGWEALPESLNTGIQQASLALSSEGLLKGSFTSAKYGKGPESLWTLQLNGRTVGQGSLERVSSGQATTLQAQLPEGGFYSGRLDLTPDALGFDDTYFLAGRVPKGFRLLMVDGESGLAPSDSEVYYVKLALESPRDPRLQSLSVLRPELLKDLNLNQYDAIVLANTGVLDEKVEEDLLAWVQQGGGLFVSAGSKWPAAPHSPLNLIRTKSVSSGGFLAKPTEVDPALAHIPGLEEFEWSEIEVHQFRPVEQLSGATAILSANGNPVLIKKKVGQGTVLIWLSSVDRAWTNFPAKPLFAPLIRELIASLADPLREQSSLSGLAGQPMRLKLPGDLKAATIVDPDGKTGGVRAGADGMVSWPSTNTPGLYRVQLGGAQPDFYFAINMAGLGKEGNTKRIRSGSFKSIFPASSVESISAGDKSQSEVLAALQGRDLTSMLAWVLALLLLIETVLTGMKTGFKFKAAAALMVLSILPSGLWAGEGNKFVYAQLQYDGAWDPYPEVHKSIFEMVQGMTNIPLARDRKVVTLSDPTLFESPFLLIKGNSALRFSAKEKSTLKQYIDGGGFIFIDDTLANPQSPFTQSVRALFSELYPDRPFERLASDHAIFRSFFLLRSAGGRRIALKYLEGLEVGGRSGGEGRTAVVFCANDLLGTWMRDHVGDYSYSCDPGGEPQRWESFKLTLNIIYFSLTGTYKRDAVHQPFIERKLGS